MKKLVAFLLAVLIVSTAVYPAFAVDNQNQQQLSPMLRGLIASSTDGDMRLLITRSNYGYMQFAANFRSSAVSQSLIQMTDKLIDTGYEPDEAKYIEVLSNIILTYDFSNAADISNQAQLDDLKGFKDYMMDAKNAAVDIVDLLSVNSEFEEALTIAIDEMSVLIDSTDNWLKALYDLDTVLQNYSFYEFFLEAVEENSDGALKSAAAKMKNSLSTILEIRLEAYADVSIDNLKEFDEFFFSDIFIDYAKNTSEYQNDVSIRFITDAADALDVLSSSWDLGKLIGKTIGNVVVGGENLINRVLEIEALYDISCALQTEFNNTYLEALKEFSDEKAKQCVHLAQVLINCRIRGEYCVYSVLASDAGLLSWACKDSAEEALEWYESQTTALLAMENRFVAILNMGIITGTVYTTESDGTPTALMNVMIIVEDADGDTARAEIMADSNEYSYVLPAGTYTITVELDGYETASKEVALDKNDVLNVDFELEMSATEIELTDYYDTTQGMAYEDVLLQELWYMINYYPDTYPNENYTDKDMLGFACEAMHGSETESGILVNSDDADRMLKQYFDIVIDHNTCEGDVAWAYENGYYVYRYDPEYLGAHDKAVITSYEHLSDGRYNVEFKTEMDYYDVEAPFIEREGTATVELCSDKTGVYFRFLNYELKEKASEKDTRVVSNGTCGDNLTWELDNDGVLTISGTGKMDKFEWDEYAVVQPWERNGNIPVVKVVIESGVTSISDWAFYGEHIESVTIPESVTDIGKRAIGYYLIDPETGDGTLDDLIINGYTGSAAETYAKENGFSFTSLGETAKQVEEGQNEQSMPLDWKIKSERASCYASDGTEIYYDDYSYPIFTGRDSEQLNKYFSDMIDSYNFMDKDTFDGDEKLQEYIDSGYDEESLSMYLPFYENYSVEISYVGEKYISYIGTTGFWTGGAHEYYYSVGAIVERATGKEVSYSDLLPNGVSLESLVKKYDTSQEVDIYDGFAPESYNLTSDGLIMYFNVGDAVPRAEVIIPLTELCIS